VVAASDSRGAVANDEGLDVEALVAHKATGQPVSTFPGGAPVAPEALVGWPCDIWVPAARPDVLTVENVADMTARLVLEGANIPASREAEEKLHAAGVVVVPDFVANAGGVICAAVEYAGGTPPQAFATIEDKIRTNTRLVLDGMADSGEPPRRVAERLAEQRVEEAMSYRSGG
jgi:glutamate dehydrogenase/leucine dehydrogenase